jgi:hypothetical protein
VFFIVSLAAPFSSSFLPCLGLTLKYRWAKQPLPCPVVKGARGEIASPRAVPGEFALPWNVAILLQSAAALPVRDDRGCGRACARAVGASTSHGVGTNVTARTRNACGSSAAGRRRSGRPDGARTMRSKPSTPRGNVRAASVPELRRKYHATPGLRRRVVTQQKFFVYPSCARPGCYEPAPKFGRNQACYCGASCRQAVRRVLDRERKWVWRGTFQGRRQRAQEYQAACARRSGQPADTASATPPRAPPP